MSDESGRQLQDVVQRRLLAHSQASPLGGFPRQRVAGVPPVVATATDLKELAFVSNYAR